MQVDAFKHLKLPKWFRQFTGFVQLVSVAGLIAGYWNKGLLSISALWIACTKLGAILFHVRVGDSLKQLVAPLLLMILSITLSLSSFPS